MNKPIDPEFLCNRCNESEYDPDNDECAVFRIRQQEAFCCPECTELLRNENPRSEIL